MSDPSCIGAGITIVDPGPVHVRRNTIWSARRRRDGTLRLLRVLVERVELQGTKTLYWRAGVRTGEVRILDEGTTWVRGHGPKARASLLAARKLAGLD